MWLSTIWLGIAFAFAQDGHCFSAALVALCWFPHHRWEKRHCKRHRVIDPS